MMNVVVYAFANEDDPVILGYMKDIGKSIAESGNTLLVHAMNAGPAEAVADGALDAGGKVIGFFNKHYPFQDRKNSKISEIIMEEEMPNNEMNNMGDAFIAVPGGFNMFTQMIDGMFISKWEKKYARYVFYNRDGFFNHLKEYFDHMAEEGHMGSMMDRILFSDDIKEMMDFINEGRSGKEEYEKEKAAEA